MARALDIALVDGVAEKIKCYANYRIIPMVSCLYGTVVTVQAQTGSSPYVLYSSIFYWLGCSARIR